MASVLLTAAMRQESAALVRLDPGWKRARLGPYRAYRASLGGQDCLLVESGMGTDRAEDAVRLALQQRPADLVISFGIAGAVRDDLRIGDVVVCVRATALENDTLGPFLPLQNLAEPAFQAGESVLQPFQARLVTGTAITTRGSQVSTLPHEIENPVLEMETAGILRALVSQEAPLLSIRAISDNPQEPIPINLEKAMDEKANLRPLILVGMLLRRPKVLLQAGRMMRNSQRAAVNAAVVVRSILTRWI